jgi:hypothetical protein
MIFAGTHTVHKRTENSSLRPTVTIAKIPGK